MKKSGPGASGGNKAGPSRAKSPENDRRPWTNNVPNSTQNGRGVRPAQAQPKRGVSKSPAVQKVILAKQQNKSKDKAKKPQMRSDLMLQLLGDWSGSRSISDLNIGSWKGITQEDTKPHGSSSVGGNKAATPKTGTVHPKKMAPDTRPNSSDSAGVYKLGEKKPVQEPHVMEPGSNVVRELGSNESSIMSMDGEGPAPEQLDLDSIQPFRAYHTVDNELVKRIMTISPNLPEAAGQKRKGFFHHGPDVLHAEKGTSTSSESKPNTNTSLQKKNDTKGKPSSRPGRHRVIVYDEKQQRANPAEKKSPYECDWIDMDGKLKRKPEDVGKVYAAYVTSGEYRLLKNFQHGKDEKHSQPGHSSDDGYGTPNYPGWTTHAPTASLDPSSTSLSMPSVPIVPPPRPTPRKRTKTSWNQTEPWVYPTLQASSRTVETQTQNRRVEFDLESNTVQLYEIEPTDSSMEAGNDNESKTRAVTDTESELDDSDHEIEAEEDETSHDPLGHLDLDKEEDRNTLHELHRCSLHDLKAGLLSVSEITTAVLHKVFKNPFPTAEQKEEALGLSETYREFLTAANDKETLELIIKAFAASCNRIMNHLNLSDAFETVLKKTGTEGNVLTGISEDVGTETEPVAEPSSHPEMRFEPVTEGNHNQYAMSLLGKSGQLLQHIFFKNIQFSLTYSSNDSSVNSLVTANRTKFEPIPLTAEKLFDIVNRNAAYVSNRLTTSKYYMNRVIEDISNLVQEFLVGKYLKPLLPTGKVTPKLKQKLQALNIYAGLLYQLASMYTAVCKNVQSSINMALKYDDYFQPKPNETFIGPRNHSRSTGQIPPDRLRGSKSSISLPLETNIPTKEAMEEFGSVIQDIDSILKTGQESLEAVRSGTKLKPQYVHVINLLLESVRQLEFGHGIDFGTVMIGLLCSTSLETTGRSSYDHRARLLLTFQKLHFSAYELVKHSKKIGLLSSFIASKTMCKLMTINMELTRSLAQSPKDTLMRRIRRNLSQRFRRVKKRNLVPLLTSDEVEEGLGHKGAESGPKPPISTDFISELGDKESPSPKAILTEIVSVSVSVDYVPNPN